MPKSHSGVSNAGGVNPLPVDLGGRVKTCRFPMWADGVKPTHEYCGEAADAGSSYCSVHRRVCHWSEKKPSLGMSQVPEEYRKAGKIPKARPKRGDQKRRCIQMLEAGMSNEEITAALECHPAYVRSCRSRLNRGIFSPEG